MISVCIATYNGGLYIKNQIDSILNQISQEDEIIICDDCSADDTTLILNRYADNRIKLFINSSRLGHVRNFERALTLSSGDYIFLADQDDVWLPGRVAKMLKSAKLNSNTLLVASNFDLIDENNLEIGKFRKLGSISRQRIVNLFLIFSGRMPYYGCTFLLKRKLLEICLPIPPKIESHDIWIALVANLFSPVVNIYDPTLQHRIHEKNLTVKSRRSIGVILISRLFFLIALFRRFLKAKFNNTFQA